MSRNKTLEFYGADVIEQVNSSHQSNKSTVDKSFIFNSSLTLFNNNAYRILSLPTDAIEKDIIARVNDLKMKSKLGLKQYPELNTGLLEVISIDEKTVISASNRLRQFEGRLIERLFWFSNINDWPVRDLTAENIKIDDYLEFMYKTLIHGVHAYSFKTLYNVGLLGLLILHNDDEMLMHINTWSNVYNLILYVYEQDDFWDTLDSYEENGGFIHSGKAISKNGYKTLAIDNLLKPFLALLNKHFDKDINSAENGLKIYYKLNLAEEVKQESVRQIMDKLEDDISQAMNTSLENCRTSIKRDEYSVEKNDIVCIGTHQNFTNEIKPKLKLFWEYAEEPTRVKRMKEVYFEYLYSMAINFTWADRYIYAQMYLLDAKKIVVAGTSDADKVENLLKKIEPAVEAKKSMSIIGGKGQNINSLFYANSDHKSCPYCKLDVPKTATICSHCNAILYETANSQPTRSYSAASPEASRNNTTESKSTSYWWVAVVIGLFLFFVFTTGGSNTESNQEVPPSSTVKTETIEYTNAKYQGETKNGEPHGKGTLTFDDGDKYTGQFQNGNFHGQGTLTFDDGNKYTGQFQDDSFHGQGTLTFANGNKYTGQFQDDTFHGKGTFTWPNGSRHVGGWFDGDASGYGTYYFSDGDRITGDWWGLSTATNATYYWSDGDSVSGIVQNDQFIDQ